MINVFFRTVDEHGDTEYFGYASAKNSNDLFWLIDQFVDPHSVQICKAKDAGFCTKTKIDHECGARFLRKKAEYSNGIYDAILGAKWVSPIVARNEIIVPWSKKSG